MTDDAREARIRAAADAVYREFTEAMNDLAGTHAISIAGIIRMKLYIEQNILPGKEPGAKLFVGHARQTAQNRSSGRTGRASASPPGSTVTAMSSGISAGSGW